MAVAQPHVEPRDHAVLFYRRDDELRDKVGQVVWAELSCEASAES